MCYGTTTCHSAALKSSFIIYALSLLVDYSYENIAQFHNRECVLTPLLDTRHIIADTGQQIISRFDDSW